MVGICEAKFLEVGSLHLFVSGAGSGGHGRPADCGSNGTFQFHFQFALAFGRFALAAYRFSPDAANVTRIGN